jgi:regulatory protein
MKLSPRKKLSVLALKMLTRREHSVFELQQKLIEKIKKSKEVGYPELIPEIIQELIQKKYLDDVRFAEVYSRSRANKGYGLLRIKRELKEKGIADFLKLSHANIRDIYAKKFGHHKPKDLREKAKQIRYLQYRGFSFEEIKKVLNHEDDE